MDAGLAWTIVGSVAAVLAIPAAVVIGILQLRQGRKGANDLPLVDPAAVFSGRDRESGGQEGLGPAGFIVMLRTVAGKPAGVGFLVGRNEVLTCAHVVNMALGRSVRSQDWPMEVVTIEFPLLPVVGGSPIRLSSHVERWLAPPLEGVTGGDIAGLRLTDDQLPDGAAPAVLAAVALRAGQLVDVFGYPMEPHRPDGGWAEARARGSVGGRLQLDVTEGSALQIQPGFNGSPVCDRDSGRVVGMLAAAPSPGTGRDAYAVGVEDLISSWSDDLPSAERVTRLVTQMIAPSTQDDNSGGGPAITKDSGSIKERSDRTHPDLDGHPAHLSEEDAVGEAYRLEMDWAASSLHSGSSVLIRCEKALVKYLAPEIAARSGRRVRIVRPDEVEVDFTGPAGSRRAGVMRALQRAMAESTQDELIVVPNFDLLVGHSEEALSIQAIELVDLLGDHSDGILLAFTDPTLNIPELVANRFELRLAVDILQSTVMAADDRAVPIGRALVTADEAALFNGFDAITLYKYIAGMNAVRLRRGLRFAYERHAAYGMHGSTFANLLQELRVFKARTSSAFEVPYASFDMIGGYQDVKAEVARALRLTTGAATLENSLSGPLLYELVPRGYIFYGPPGTGKTLFAKAIANDLYGTIRTVASSEILSLKRAEAEYKIRDLFTEARRNAPAVLVFDDIDLIAPRSPGSGTGLPIDTVATTLLAELDGLRHQTPVLVVGITKQIEAVNAKLFNPGPLKPISIDLPDDLARRQIILLNARHFGIEASEAMLNTITDATDGMSGADIYSILRDARVNGMLSGPNQ